MNQTLTDNDKKLLGSPTNIGMAQEIVDAGHKFSLESIEELRWPTGFITVAWRMSVQGADKKPVVRIRARSVEEVIQEAYDMFVGPEE